ncbi:ribonuclease III [Nitratireductor indicus C115]|uniref:Ribonuclease III n=1 Tax=Nitratireductor indicus C115 TaxID=1231190 RepID=K2NXJ0_9HYPH|nr:hypothetical protein [Nitratireductor indicus]EKF43965.1 ribonuclease III [Nitratireductor indicus C115]SFQ13185.1 hypothetical protein SAMN05216176_101492 [Nitratireductor indicus]
MALQPDLIGAVTLTAGSNEFTWAGASLVGGAIQEGDTIHLPGSGLSMVIATVTGATTGTLTDNCPAAAAGAGQVARIRYQADLSRVAAKTWQLIELLGGGNLSALAGLEGAAGKIPLFTGPGVLDLMNILPVQLDKHDVQNAPNSFYAKLLRVDGAINAKNAFYGEYYGGSANKNIDTLLPGETGLFSISNPGTFPPDVGTFWFIETQRQLYNDTKHQTAHRYGGTSALPSIWYRVASTTNVYSRWLPLIPVRGDNANGSYVRLGDGTQICWSTIDLTNTDMSTPRGAFFSPASYLTWTFPAAFSTAPAISASFQRASYVPSAVGIYSQSLAVANLAPWSSISLASGISKSVYVQAIGRWY